MSDPNLQWDGARWLRWDGQQWVDASEATPSGPGPTASGPPSNGPPPKKSTGLIIGIAVGAVVLVLVAGVIVGVVWSRRSVQQAVPSADPTLFAPTVSPTATAAPTVTVSPTPTTPSPTTASPVEPVTTKFFISPQPDGATYAAGVKTVGTTASGWSGYLRTGDIACFSGTVSGGMLTGTLVIPPDGGGAPAKQPFSWKASGQGPSFALLSIGDFSQVIEVPVATVNQKAGLPATDDWAKLFASCAELAGGIR
ncbi:MAG: hypothetical protein WCP28_03320 [Actinomycetes bacterium]